MDRGGGAHGPNRRGVGACRGADGRVLRDAARPGVQRDGAARPQFGALDDRGRALFAIREPRPRDLRAAARRYRSEEHTSELQSLLRLSYAVFCLKKNITYPPAHSMPPACITQTLTTDVHTTSRHSIW